MPTPKIYVFGDWNLDGDFTDANEDITADVQYLKWSRGKNVLKHRAEAALLELKLSNDDHKYTPPKIASTVFTAYTKPDLWVLVGYPVDDFNAADTTTLTSRKPSHDSLFDAWSGDTGDFDVLSNKIRTATGANKSAVLDFAETDCWVGCKYTRGGTTSGVIVRWSDASNYLLVYHDGTNIRLGEVVSGTLTSLASAALTWTAGDEKWVFVEMHGDDIRVMVDRALQFTHTTTRFNTATKHGIGGRGTHADDRWEDFGGWVPKFFGTLDVIQPRPEINHQYAYIRAFDDMERMANHQVYRTAPDVDGTDHGAPASDGVTYAYEILGEILDAVDASSANRVIETETTVALALTTTANHEKAMGLDGLTEAYQVADDDVGFFYIDGYGTYHYEKPRHRENGPHATACKTWYEQRQAQDETDIYFVSIEWDDGKDRVENEVYYSYYRVARVTGTTVWSLEVLDNPAIVDGQVLDLVVVGEGDVIANPIPPIHTTDFTVNTDAGGGGTDLLTAEDSNQSTVTVTATTLDDTGQDFTKSGAAGRPPLNDGKHVVIITDAGGDIAVAFISGDPDGDGTKVTLYKESALTNTGYMYSGASFSTSDGPLTYAVYDVTVELVTGFEGNFRLARFRNNSGSDGFITSAKLRADKGTASNKTAGRAENSRSQLRIGRRRVQHDTLHIDDFDVAKGKATERLTTRNVPHPRSVIEMSNGTRANLMQILHRGTSDRVNLNYSGMGIDSDHYIERQTVEITEGGLFVECTWDLTEEDEDLWEWAHWNHGQWG